MKRTDRELAAMMDNFARVLRGAEVRLTPQRLEIYRQTAATTDHPDIDAIHREVHRTLPCVSLDTIYRALALFAKLGLISAVRPPGRHVRFDANLAPHHHFICTRCGAAVDFEDRDLDLLPIPRAAAALGRVESRHVEFHGACTSCAAGAPTPRANRVSAPRPARSPRSIGTRSPSPIHKNKKEGLTCPKAKRP